MLCADHNQQLMHPTNKQRVCISKVQYMLFLRTIVAQKLQILLSCCPYCVICIFKILISIGDMELLIAANNSV